MLLSFPNGEHRAVRIEPGCLCIGSDDDNELVIAHPGLAGRHACIVCDRRGLILEVEPGAGDVHVNGRPVQRRALLRLGDVIHLAGLELRLSIESSMIRVPPPAQPGSGAGNASELDAEAAPRVVLRGITGAWFGRLVVLRGRTVIGRDPDCELCIDDPELSRRHAQIENTGRGLILRDLDSANGTFVNGVQVRDAVLAPGDQISFDVHRFVLEAPGYQPRGEPAEEPVSVGPGRTTRVVPAVKGAAEAARVPADAQPQPRLLDEAALWWIAAATVALAAIAAVLLMN